jgi:alpha-ketoglutarate-dependent taurine dioxygenase
MLSCKPLNGSFGVEVFDAGLGTPEAEEHAAELLEALHRHQLLLFSGQSLTVEAQLRVTSLFGRSALPWDPTHAHPASPYVEVFRESSPCAYKRPAEHWRPGDLLVWDNPSLLRHGEAVPPGLHRRVHRKTARYAGRAR